MPDQKQPEQPEQPSQEDMQQMQQVSQAGAQAQASGEDVGQAMKHKRDEVGFTKLDDETIDALAAKLNELNLESFREAGAFDPPPEPVQPPAQPQAPPAAGERPQDQPLPQQPPQQKRTAAHRFLGIP